MRLTKMALAVAVSVGAALSIAAVPAGAAVAPQTSTPSTIAAYTGSAQDEANTKAFYEAVMEKVKEKQAAQPGIQSVTVYYNASNAPSFASEISQSASIWNSRVSNVKLAATSGSGDFAYYEGNDTRGSYASTDGHGSGYIFLDYAQNEQYYSLRVVAHETGHVLGLPDHYSGPCSELMSGGGPGTSCTNAYPNSTEASQVNSLWANGVAPFDKPELTKVR
ncbi:snapalysin [Streptomyces meridianus]|uniref:Extracellular small neutral protease n=1 Tax=Streptomyces meridianus TaxID=2938945 RepID=A0ABT0X9C8_9ACTN|nr:snapalysin [Streptomyces meridianus]MCM2579014.1 snapalysin [Streptomyces meridianus]